MSNKSSSNISISIIALLLVGAAISSAFISREKAAGSIPKMVIEKYQELKRDRYYTIAVSLSRCVKGQEVIYQVSGSGGFTGDRFFFDSEGKQIWHWVWKDTIDPNEPKVSAPINISDYQCTKLYKSAGGR